jgi:dTDP-4-amino-4,6-dideoxygalactose transaminase
LFAPWPVFSEDEIEAVTAVLRSGKVNYWTGTEGQRFEDEFASYVGCKYGIAVANGTVALELALRAYGIGNGDQVITSSRTFLATASSIVAVGATPVFADVDRDSQNVTAGSISAVLTPATKAIIVVHLAGQPCEMDEINSLARKHGLRVIEDCAQAHGATYKGQPVGSLGGIGAFSFCQDKNMTTAGEGGMATTNSPELWRRMWAYKDHGKCYDAVFHREHPAGFRWLHESFGTNWRLSEVQSAVGRAALRKLPEWVAIRRRHAHCMTQRLSRLLGLRIPLPSDHLHHSYYRYYAFIDPEVIAPGWDRDRVANAIRARGVPCSVGSCSEVYLEKAFPAKWRPSTRLPVARELGETSLAFLVHPTLSEAAIRRTCDVIEEVMSNAVQAQAGIS